VEERLSDARVHNVSGSTSLEAVTQYSLTRYFIALAAIVVVLVGSVWVWAANGRMWFLDPEYPMWSAKMQMAKECRTGDTIILGASRSMAGIIPEQLGSGVSNLALGGSSPVENFYMAQRVLKCPTPPKNVIIAFLPLFVTEANFYWARSALFGFFDFDEMEDVRRESIATDDGLLYSTNRLTTALDVVRNYSYRVSLPSYYFGAMMNAGFVGRKTRNDEELALTLRNRGQHFFGRSDSSNIIAADADMEKFEIRPLLAEYMDRLLRELQKAGVVVYLASPPLNPATYAQMSPQVVSDFERYLGSLRASYSNVKTLGEPVHSLPASYFGDREHLNPKGAAAWTASLREGLAKSKRE